MTEENGKINIKKCSCGIAICEEDKIPFLTEIDSRKMYNIYDSLCGLSVISVRVNRAEDIGLCKTDCE